MSAHFVDEKMKARSLRWSAASKWPQGTNSSTTWSPGTRWGLWMVHMTRSQRLYSARSCTPAQSPFEVKAKSLEIYLPLVYSPLGCTASPSTNSCSFHPRLPSEDEALSSEGKKRQGSGFWGSKGRSVGPRVGMSSTPTPSLPSAP